MKEITKNLYDIYKKREIVRVKKEVERKELPIEKYQRLKKEIVSFSESKKSLFKQTIKI